MSHFMYLYCNLTCKNLKENSWSKKFKFITFYLQTYLFYLFTLFVYFIYVLTHSQWIYTMMWNIHDAENLSPWWFVPVPDQTETIHSVIKWDENHLQCPVCDTLFQTKQDLILHASEHARKGRRPLRSHPCKPFKCLTCWKSFSTDERLQKHMLCHSDKANKPYKCDTCSKHFMNNSALACHLKTHSDKKYYDCPMCNLGFDQIHAMKEHVVEHAINGMYDCPECHKSFPDYKMIRRHLKAFHSTKTYRCMECMKDFSRPDKLKLHMLKHSNHREFMCETCGRQFKRKDKLSEHVKRMHNPMRPKRDRVMQALQPKKFSPKVEPNDYNRFIYKCHTCMLGFKRRGMLVNHLAKRHPEMKSEDIPELNLPILRTHRDYFCQYCDKVYKSSSKRKMHIIKYHPGGELPPSIRTKSILEKMGMSNASFSQPAGSVTTMPHGCELCHKQYASKAKLLQHQRKKHPEVDISYQDRRPIQIQVMNTSLFHRYLVHLLKYQTCISYTNATAYHIFHRYILGTINFKHLYSNIHHYIMNTRSLMLICVFHKHY